MVIDLAPTDNISKITGSGTSISDIGTIITEIINFFIQLIQDIISWFSRLSMNEKVIFISILVLIGFGIYFYIKMEMIHKVDETKEQTHYLLRSKWRHK